MSLYCSFSSTPLQTFFYQIEILPQDVPSSSSLSLSVGVVRPSEVKKGWGTKGMFYNGNLTNGSAALKVGYGPRLKPGDVVIVEYRYIDEDKKHRVKFHVNGQCLGTAFEISTDNSEMFVPCLNCQGQVQVQTQVTLTRKELFSHLVTSARKTNLWEGDWTLVQAWKLPESLNQQDGMTTLWPLEISHPGIPQHTPTLHMEALSTDETNKDCAMVVKVCNSMRVIKRISHSPVSESETDIVTRTTEYILENPEGDASPSVVLATKMMPPPPFVEVEQHLSQALASDWKALRVANDGKVMQVASRDGIILAQFERRQHDQEQVACKSY